MTHLLVTAGFVIGAIVGNLLFFQYLSRSRWRDSMTGHVLLALFFVFALGYDLSSLVLLFPAVFTEDNGGIWIRIGLRFLIDTVLVGMYILLVKAQRQDRYLPPAPPPPEGVRQSSTE